MFKTHIDLKIMFYFFKEIMSNETIAKCLNSKTNDIELDFLLAKTTTLSSSLSLINQLVNISF